MYNENMEKITYKIYSLGCKVNQYDSFKLGAILQKSGFCPVEKNASLAIVNTCAVTKSAISKSNRMLTRAKKENKKAKIILMGCWPKAYRDRIDKKKLGLDLIWEVGEEKKMLAKIKKLFKISKKICFHPETISLETSQDRARYFLKIQDGCEQFCAYCIIPHTRGRLYSRLTRDIIVEARRAVKKGYREIVLSGIHLGLFGINNRDKAKEEKRANLVSLLKGLERIRGLEKIRLSSIEITEITSELISFMARSKKMCQHLHVPLQSGSDKILKLMKRPYITKYFSDKIKKIRFAMPDIALSTDVIVGFPGETKKDFNDTTVFIKKIKFSRLHVFSFSPHEKVPASSLPFQVKGQEIKRRSRKLRNLSGILEREYEKKFLGRVLEVVVEAKNGSKLKGKSQYYFDIWFPKEKMVKKANFAKIIGKVVKIKF